MLNLTIQGNLKKYRKKMKDTEKTILEQKLLTLGHNLLTLCALF